MSKQELLSDIQAELDALEVRRLYLIKWMFELITEVVIEERTENAG